MHDIRKSLPITVRPTNSINIAAKITRREEQRGKHSNGKEIITKNEINVILKPNQVSLACILLTNSIGVFSLSLYFVNKKFSRQRERVRDLVQNAFVFKESFQYNIIEMSMN